jgi:hypothetical protein
MFLFIGRMINVTPVSSSDVRQINDVINCNNPSSNASVNEVQNMQFRWKQDITLPKEECLRVTEGTVLYSCVCCIGHAKILPIALDKINKIWLLLL